MEVPSRVLSKRIPRNLKRIADQCEAAMQLTLSVGRVRVRARYFHPNSSRLYKMPAAQLGIRRVPHTAVEITYAVKQIRWTLRRWRARSSVILENTSAERISLLLDEKSFAQIAQVEDLTGITF